MNGLFEDFLVRANFDSKDQPRRAMQCSRLVNPHPTLALCAISVGWSRGDNSLIRLASESYHHALQFVRQHTADAHLKSSALALVIATNDLCKYEVCYHVVRGPHILTRSHSWLYSFVTAVSQSPHPLLGNAISMQGEESSHMLDLKVSRLILQGRLYARR